MNKFIVEEELLKHSNILINLRNIHKKYSLNCWDVEENEFLRIENELEYHSQVIAGYHEILKSL